MPPEDEKPTIFSRLFTHLSGRSSNTSEKLRDSPYGTDGRSSRSSSDQGLSLAPENSTAQGLGFQESPNRETLLRAPPPWPFPAQYPGDNLTGPIACSGTSFLSGASRFRMGDIQYTEGSQVTVHNGGSTRDNSIDGWQLLLENTAVNALHDSDARYDPPKCDEDTRVEVVGEIMDWIKDRDGPQRVLCMTGAAGSGKSALQQTIAEKCQGSGTLASSFFFSALDPSRNTIKHVIPTIAYQLGRSAILKQRIKAAVESDPLIFSKSLRAQTTALIVEPLLNCQTAGMDIRSLPHALLVDGLDECASEDRQAEFLIAIKECLLADGLPFRIFIASRPEWAIRTALEAGGHLQSVAHHIRLSDKYDATEDMRRYLRRRFEDIGLRIGNLQWFTQDDIDTFVKAASGQFIYVAMVFKYISARRASPAERLKIVLTWTPHEGQRARPFEELDRLYTNILLAAKATYEAVDSHHGRDFLLLLNAYILSSLGFSPQLSSVSYNRYYPADAFSEILCLEARAEETIISDLHSLLSLEKHDNGFLLLSLYHKSFVDFLREASRAKELFVPESCVCTHLAKCLLQRIIGYPLDLDSLPHEWRRLPLNDPSTRCAFSRTVEDLPFYLSQAATIGKEVADFTRKGGWSRLDKLLPVVYSRGWLPKNWARYWINCLGKFTSDLKVREPELAAEVNQFAERWIRIFEEWNRQRARGSRHSGFHFDDTA